MDIPNLLTKQLIDTTDTFSIAQDSSITMEQCEDTLFIAVRNYKNQDMTDQVNDQLSIAQKIYADSTPILNYSSKADSFSCKVVSFKALGPFLKVFILSNATVNNQYLFNQRNILIHMPTGEQLAVRDLLLPESIDTLTEQQLTYLDSTDFSLDSSGKIVVPLQPPTEEGTTTVYLYYMGDKEVTKAEKTEKAEETQETEISEETQENTTETQDWSRFFTTDFYESSFPKMGVSAVTAPIGENIVSTFRSNIPEGENVLYYILSCSFRRIIRNTKRISY